MKKILILAGLAVLTSSSAYATNGMFSHGYGTKNRALAGAGVAVAQGALSSATNPASMAYVGNRMDIGAELFAPRRSFESASTFGFFPDGAGAGTKVESQNDWFLIPHFGYNLDLGASSVGIAVYGNGGQNVEYEDDDTTFRFGPFFAGKASQDLVQVFTNLSYSYKLSQGAVGMSLILGVQSLELRGLQNFAPFTETFAQTGNLAAVDDLTDNGKDYAYGAGLKFGYMGKMSPTISFGLSYQTKIYMTEFDDYSDALAESGDLDVPATLTYGMAWQATPKSTFLFDLQYIWYSDVNAIGNGFEKSISAFLFPIDNSSGLGGNSGPGFGWEDMPIIKLGWEWEANPEWTWRVGFSHATQPIPDNEVLFNVLAPAVVKNHITFGFTKQMSKKSEFNFAAMYAPKNSVTGATAIGANQSQVVTLEMHQYSVEASWGTTF